MNNEYINCTPTNNAFNKKELFKIIFQIYTIHRSCCAFECGVYEQSMNEPQNRHIPKMAYAFNNKSKTFSNAIRYELVKPNM